MPKSNPALLFVVLATLVLAAGACMSACLTKQQTAEAKVIVREAVVTADDTCQILLKLDTGDQKLHDACMDIEQIAPKIELVLAKRAKATVNPSPSASAAKPATSGK
jgi:hypothetical protein